MAVAKKRKIPEAVGTETDLSPDIIGQTLATYAERVSRTLGRLGYQEAQSHAVGQAEWVKTYFESDGRTTHRVTLILSTDNSGLSPVRVENVVITSQRVLPPDQERWVNASGSVTDLTGVATAEPTEEADHAYTGPYARDVAYALRALDIETRGSVVDMVSCSKCGLATDSWLPDADGKRVCPVCV